MNQLWQHIFRIRDITFKIKTKLLKHITYPKEFTFWEKLFIKKKKKMVT